MLVASSRYLNLSETLCCYAQTHPWMAEVNLIQQTQTPKLDISGCRVQPCKNLVQTFTGSGANSRIG